MTPSHPLPSEPDLAALSEALARYGFHTVDCRWEKAGCTCGWDTFLADYDANPEPARDGLDVERLARAITTVEDAGVLSGRWDRLTTADNGVLAADLAAEYDRLAPDRDAPREPA